MKIFARETLKTVKKEADLKEPSRFFGNPKKPIMKMIMKMKMIMIMIMIMVVVMIIRDSTG